MEAPKLFISFSSQDIDYAEAFVASLVQRVGHDSVFFAPHTIGAGEQYFDSIMQYLNSCSAVILLASASSVGCSHSGAERSKHVTRELKESDDLNLPIYPIDIDGVLQRGSCDAGTRYIIGSYQYLDGQMASGDGSFSHLIELLMNALENNRAYSQDTVEERLRNALQQGQVQHAATIARPLDLAKLDGNAAMLAIIAELRNRGSLANLPLKDAQYVAHKIGHALERECSQTSQSLGLYMAGVLCKEVFQKRVIQCSLGSYPQLKVKAQKLPRLSISDKKLVRELSNNFRAFEADWFFGS